MPLDNRELATLGWIVVALVVVFAVKRFRDPAIGVLRALGDWRILGSFGGLAVWSGGIVVVAARLGYLYPDLIKDATIVVATVGFPVLFNAVGEIGQARMGGKTVDGPSILRRIRGEALSLSAAVFTFLNIEPFALPLEVVLVPVYLSAVLLWFRAGRRAGWKPARSCLSIVLALGVIGVSIWTVGQLIASAGTRDWASLLLEVLLTVWLPFAMFPYLYAVVFAAVTEDSTVWLRKVRKPPALRRVSTAAVLGFHLRISWARSFRSWHPYESAVGDARNFRDGVRAMRQFRDDVRVARELEAERQAHLVASRGQLGTDGTGAQLDRWEFMETKRAFARIEISQMLASPRYWEGDERCDELLAEFDRYGLPENHGIHVEVSADGKAWRAWRLMPSTSYLGFGGRDGQGDEYHFAGLAAPVGFPGSPEWMKTTFRPESEYLPDWERYDEPIPGT